MPLGNCVASKEAEHLCLSMDIPAVFESVVVVGERLESVQIRDHNAASVRGDH